jgi:acyl dehydratase
MSDTHELRVTPDKYLPFRYAGASGDFNPIHLDAELARAVGFPSNILHGLWSMAQVARAAVEAGGGDPRSLTRLSVQFRGIGLPEQEIVVSATRTEEGRLELVARQEERQIVKNAEAELVS